MPSDEKVEKVKNAIRDAVGCHTATGRPGVGCMTMDVPELCSCWVAAEAAISAAHAEPVAARSSFGPGSYLADVMTMGTGRQSHASPSEAAIRADEMAAIRKEAFEEAARVAEEYARQNRGSASKARSRAAKLGRIGDVFGHGEMADTAAMELDACGNEADAIATAIRARGER